MTTDKMGSAVKTAPNVVDQNEPDPESSGTSSTNEDAPGKGMAKRVLKEKQVPGSEVHRASDGEEDDAGAFGRRGDGGQNVAAAGNSMKGADKSGDKIQRKLKMPPSLYYKFKDEDKNAKLVTPPRRSLSRSPSGSPVSSDLYSSQNWAGRNAGSRSQAGVSANTRMTRSFASAGNGDADGYDTYGRESDDSPYYDLSGMEGLTQDEIYEMLYEEQLLAAAGVSRSGLSEEERAARRDRIKRRRESRARAEQGETGSENLGKEDDGKSGPKYFRAADGTVKKIRSQPEYLEDLMEGGVPIKSWLIVGALLGVGLFQLGRALKAPKAWESSGKVLKHVKKSALDSPGSPSRKRGSGKIKGKKSGSGKTRSVSVRKHSKNAIGRAHKKATSIKKSTEEPPTELPSSDASEEEKKECDKTLPRKVPEEIKEMPELPEIEEELDVEVLLSMKKKSSTKKKKVRKKSKAAQASEGDKADSNGVSGHAPVSDESSGKPPSPGVSNADTLPDMAISRDETVSNEAAKTSPESQHQEFLDGMDDKDRHAVMEALGEDKWQKHAAEEGGWQTAGSRKATRKKSSARGEKAAKETSDNSSRPSGQRKNNGKTKPSQPTAPSEEGSSVPVDEKKAAQEASTDDFSVAVAAIDQLPLPSETDTSDGTEACGKHSEKTQKAEHGEKESKHVKVEKADATNSSSRDSDRPVTANGDTKETPNVNAKKADITHSSKPTKAEGNAKKGTTMLAKEVAVAEVGGKDNSKPITVECNQKESANDASVTKTDSDAKIKVIGTGKTSSQPVRSVAPAKEGNNADTSSDEGKNTEDTTEDEAKPKEEEKTKPMTASKNGEKKLDPPQQKVKTSTKAVVLSREEAQLKETTPSVEDDAALARKLQMQEENLAGSAGHAENDAWEQVVTKKSKRRSTAGGKQGTPSVQ
mmetsp:Transcript_43842/g.133488  ORF Transcript_43842/g.133488 Transcript_43842/m.133488 type:complete len:925 (-) Transcript_43842:200-2974(-)